MFNVIRKIALVQTIMLNLLIYCDILVNFPFNINPWELRQILKFTLVPFGPLVIVNQHFIALGNFGGNRLEKYYYLPKSPANHRAACLSFF